MQRDITATITAIASLVLVAGPGARAADQTATWNGTAGNWSDASEWSTTHYPDNGNGGVATYDAEIIDGFGDNVVTLDVDVTIESFNLDAVASSGALNRSANLTVNDTFTWTRGSIAGNGTLILAAGSTSNVTVGGDTNLKSGNLINNGTYIRDDSSGALSRLLLTNAGFINHGTVDVRSDGGSFLDGSHTSTFMTNTGTFLKSAGTGIAIINNVPFTNSGIVESRSGTIEFNRTGGSETIRYTQTAGKLLLNGGDVISDNTMDIQGGSIEGEGTISSDLLLAGTISPGTSIGTLTIDDVGSGDGNVTFASGGEYVAELGTPGLADLLDITGTLDLSTSGDTLTLSGGVLGETYTIANFNQVIGSFDNVTPGYLPTYNTDSLQVTVVPEPGSISLLALSGMLLLRRRKSQPRAELAIDRLV